MTETDDSPVPGTAPSAPRRIGWRRLVIGPIMALGLMAASVLSLAPVVPKPGAPDAATAAAARRVLQQISGTARGDLVKITLSQRELDGLAALSSEALSPLRIQARLHPVTVEGQTQAMAKAKAGAEAGELVIDLSRNLGLGLWLNAHAIVRASTGPSAAGLPQMTLTLGHLPVPQWLTHRALNHLWQRAQGGASRPVTLDQALRRFTVSPDLAKLELVNPGRGAALSGLAQAGGDAPDPGALAAAYCAIADTGGTNLAVLVRRAAALAIAADVTPQAHNRVILNAIAMRAVPEYRDRLAGAALQLISRCGASPEPVTLAGRADLAKHWSLSAALTATIGGQAAQSMGTWKELADSSKGGSGFSFVDLSADRSGERFAMAAVDPQLARSVHARLVAITEDQMLPREALARPEGLDQATFERTYTAVTSPEYAHALAMINQLLDNAGVP